MENKKGNAKMKQKEKRLIVLLVVVLVIAVVVIMFVSMSRNKQETTIGSQSEIQGVTETQVGDNNANTSTRVNTNEGFNAIKRYKDLELSNIQLSENNGTSVLLADVTNKGDGTHEQETVKITIVGEDESETTVNAIIGTIEPGKTIKINTSMTADVVSGKEIKIEAVE